MHRTTAWCFQLKKAAAAAHKKGQKLKRSYFGNGDCNAVSLFAHHPIRGFDAQST
jgi:hypothetical protein